MTGIPGRFSTIGNLEDIVPRVADTLNFTCAGLYRIGDTFLSICSQSPQLTWFVIPFQIRAVSNNQYSLECHNLIRLEYDGDSFPVISTGRQHFLVTFAKTIELYRLDDFHMIWNKSLPFYPESYVTHSVAAALSPDDRFVYFSSSGMEIEVEEVSLLTGS